MLHLGRNPKDRFSHETAPFLFRFTNARRRIIQPMLEANNTKEAIEKLARYTSHHMTWSFNTDPDAADDQKPTNIQPGKLPVSQPQPAPGKLQLHCINSTSPIPYAVIFVAVKMTKMLKLMFFSFLLKQM